jgi:hypothetical protein
MKIQEYETMLRAVEQALEVCHKSSGFMDKVHREICENLSATRDRLLALIRTPHSSSRSPLM